MRWTTSRPPCALAGIREATPTRAVMRQWRSRKNQRGELRTSDISPQLTTGGGKPGEGYPAVAFDLNQITSKTNRSQPDPAVHHTLPATSLPPHLASPWAVRRLTPLEAERLMGFPDDFTRIPYRNKPAENCPDGPRYKALGNSWAVNCADWLAERIRHVEAILKSEAA